MQNVFIINFNSLYEILDEIKENLSFKIIKFENEEDFKKKLDLDRMDYLLILKNNHKLLLNYNVTDKNLKENFYRKDHKYDYIISINHNEKKTPSKGSAIFIHLTNNYKPTAGCVALKKKDFEILLKLIDKKTKIKIG